MFLKCLSPLFVLYFLIKLKNLIKIISPTQSYGNVEEYVFSSKKLPSFAACESVSSPVPSSFVAEGLTRSLQQEQRQDPIFRLFIIYTTWAKGCFEI